MGFGKDGKGVMLRSQANDQALGTLGSGTALKIASAPFTSIEEDFRLLKLKWSVALKSFTSNEGPLYFGIADNELSVAEIAEAIEAAGPTDRNDREGNEEATRPVWLLGQFVNNDIVPDTGLFEETVLRWTFSDTEGFTWFVYNQDGTPLTTGALFSHNCTAFGVWVT